MEWEKLKEEAQIEALAEESKKHPVVIFKHSTSCSISATAKSRFERQWVENEFENVKPYFLDLLAHRAGRHRQLVGGAAEVQMPRGGLERPQGIERREAAALLGTIHEFS
jgi:hypothetical protein